MMIVEYLRPLTVEDAIRFLSREDPKTIPLMGEATFLREVMGPVAVVDLQALGLDTMVNKNKTLEIGPMVTLQALMETVSTMPGLVSVIQHEATYNRRQLATVAGSVLIADGRSPFATAMLALDAHLHYATSDAIEEIGELFSLQDRGDRELLIEKFVIPTGVNLAYQYVARTPADLPIVCVVVVRWPSGRTRVSVGGYGKTPKLAMDGPNPLGAETAARDVYREANDQWAGALYRSEMAGILTKRCLELL